ncbi:DUF6412 domain-containing protein [Streptomyces sp. CBMA152]|uniref:DUF6412 domain-containing protein n=1 Tax=Streptomyces sp. CBMA152 TaxID=1896312 RepID=UPI001CB726C3|nr:DUF6412 domain-containing protein [Streptomyces sp. CBMA152]
MTGTTRFARPALRLPSLPSVRLTFSLLLFLLVEVLLIGGGTLSGAVALAATAAAGSALAACATLASRAVPRVARTRIRTAIRDRERRTAFLPQRDPDASGRPRPRAPGRLAPTAA